MIERTVLPTEAAGFRSVLVVLPVLLRLRPDPVRDRRDAEDRTRHFEALRWNRHAPEVPVHGDSYRPSSSATSGSKTSSHPSSEPPGTVTACPRTLARHDGGFSADAERGFAESRPDSGSGPVSTGPLSWHVGSVAHRAPDSRRRSSLPTHRARRDRGFQALPASKRTRVCLLMSDGGCWYRGDLVRGVDRLSDSPAEGGSGRGWSGWGGRRRAAPAGRCTS